jgi:hypothetical protein
MSIQTKLLEQAHPIHAERRAAWGDVDLLYRGGYALRARAGEFLVRRPRELEEVFLARVGRFTYQNILGAAIGWYQAALFETDPEILVRRKDTDVQRPDGEFFGEFLENCDRGGRSFSNLFRDAFLNCVLFKSAFVLVDLPAGIQAATLAEQRAAGGLDPYVVLYDPRQALNWAEDAAGNLEWIVFRSTEERRGFAEKTETVDRWYYFDREVYRVYEATRKDGNVAEVAEMVAEGSHALAAAKRVPVRRIEIPADWWLADRVYLQALDHLNQDNSFGWALFMANLPVPVIKGDFESTPQVSETAYIHLSENGAFEWAEPTGTSFQHSAARIASLREEIYRQMYLQAQGKDSTAVASAQSGFSKAMDMAPSRDVLNGFGDLIREAMKGVLEDVATVRGLADVTFDVRGFDFAEDDTDQVLATVETAGRVAIPSDTLEKETWKRAARALLRDALPETVAKVEAEIDAAPSREERAAAAREEMAAGFKASLQGATKDGGDQKDGKKGGVPSDDDLEV